MKKLHRPISTIVIIVAMLALGGAAFAIFKANQTTSTPPHANATEQVELFGIVAQEPATPICEAAHGCNAPVVDHTIQAIDANGKIAGETKTDNKGAYKLKLKPGHYVLQLVPQVDVYHLKNNEIDLTTTSRRLDLILDSGIR